MLIDHQKVPSLQINRLFPALLLITEFVTPPQTFTGRLMYKVIPILEKREGTCSIGCKALQVFLSQGHTAERRWNEFIFSSILPRTARA